VLLAKQYNIGLNIDAEEADRLELSLDLMEALAADPELAGFEGIGFVVQAYQKRCPFVIDYLIDLAKRSGRKFMVRLVKGAYWDAEIKRAQVDGMSGYPVYTQGLHRRVLPGVRAKTARCTRPDLSTICHPQRANPVDHLHLGQARRRHRLRIPVPARHGRIAVRPGGRQGQPGQACRIYAPVGTHETLLAYLVRRLLENGANSSFVNQIVDEAIPIESLLKDPVASAREQGGLPHPASRCRWTCLAPSARTRPASTWPMKTPARDCGRAGARRAAGSAAAGG
jgi:RHH-type proline utilization regulon transcriptional repressor/proline dehydrogenase/delta 1-pyrroline-5-carboxylate dehydrogenase